MHLYMYTLVWMTIVIKNNRTNNLNSIQQQESVWDQLIATDNFYATMILLFSHLI